MTEATGLTWRVTDTMGLRLALTDAEGREIAAIAMSDEHAAQVIYRVSTMMASIIMTPFPRVAEPPMEG